MQLGMIGLGRMGGNIVRRLMRHGHSTVVYDKDAKAVAAIATEGAVVGRAGPCVTLGPALFLMTSRDRGKSVSIHVAI